MLDVARRPSATLEPRVTYNGSGVCRSTCWSLLEHAGACWSLKLSGYSSKVPRCDTAVFEVACLCAFTSLPCAQDTGTENLRIDTTDVLKLLVVGDSAVRLLITLGARSAW